MSNFEKSNFVYEGKAKKIFEVKDQSELLWLEFKDSLTAFNAEKKGEFSDKGLINKKIAVLIFKFLESRGISHHLVEDIDETSMVCKKLEIIPLEVVVRNVLAGSTAKKFNIEEGTPLEKPLVEFFLKNDELGDPFLSDDQALMLKAAKDQEQLDQLKEKALEINTTLIEFFDKVGIRLIDFKLEFGLDSKNEILLGDEITPDSCRLWDKDSNEKLDKDRFRRDLGKVKESYTEVLSRIENQWRL